MVIHDSNISMASLRSHAEKEAHKSSLKLWTGPRPQEGREQGGLEARPFDNDRERVRISDEARSRFESMKKRFVEGRRREIDVDPAEGLGHEQLIKKLLIEALTGRKIKVMNLEPLDGKGAKECAGPAAQAAQDPASDWGMEYNETHTVAEFEAISFSASGVIRTADGEEIEFTMSLEMMRASVTEESLNVKAGNAVDPLVVNFGGKAAELTSARFSFDLDADGDTEDIPFVGPGSGLLVLDRDGDGRVKDGSELFGPSSGNGFSELAALDLDGNSWIDERDQAYNSLFVWTRDSAGNDVMRGLKEANVGAIYLAYEQTSFELRDSSNAQTGQVRSTGVYLTEDMSMGTIQQLDLVV